MVWEARDARWEVRDVQEVPQEATRTPLTAEEELRSRSVFATEIGAQLARQGWAVFPAHTPEERIRLFAVARIIEQRLGRRVEAVPEDICSMRFTVVSAGAAHEVGPAAGASGQLDD
ncbi:hypothetical protein [Streptomyces phaeochromogenes]|uniref:hypothetical protein n=1 Tax=Streptomyces phaeochromogenes TaxID=1923 RepID=UPI00386C929A|nr:hypothetical protein OG478_40965 [Streptomyces phaeochromogenes]WTA08085.1 hypothetical protein OHB08_40435 [Streptomyces phaeochromogenes]